MINPLEKYMKNVIIHQLKFSQKANSENNDNLNKFFENNKKKINYSEIPLNSVTFIKIFSNFLKSLNIKVELEEKSKFNFHMFDLTLFTYFFFSFKFNDCIETLINEIFDLVEKNSSLTIKKNEIIILNCEEILKTNPNFCNNFEIDCDRLFLFFRGHNIQVNIKNLLEEYNQTCSVKLENIKIHHIVPKFKLNSNMISKIK